MSSYYTAAELEARRKAKLKQDLADSISKLKEQLRAEHENKAQITAGANIEMTVFAEDNAVGGYSGKTVVSADTLQSEGSRDGSVRDELDLSGLLISAHKKPTKLEQELDQWIRKAEERPIISEKDEKDRTRLLAELAKTVNAPDTDIEDKVRAVRMRVTAYLQGQRHLCRGT